VVLFFCYCFFVVVVLLYSVEDEGVDTLTFVFAAASLTANVSCLEFCSNVFAVLTPIFDMCFELSFACCNTDFIESAVCEHTLQPALSIWYCLTFCCPFAFSSSIFLSDSISDSSSFSRGYRSSYLPVCSIFFA
jgi:hypothetical protein